MIAIGLLTVGFILLMAAETTWVRKIIRAHVEKNRELTIELHEVKTENEYIKTHELSTVRAQCARLTDIISQCQCESKLAIIDDPKKPRLVSQMASFEHGE